MRAQLCADGQGHDFALDYRTLKVSGRITAIPDKWFCEVSETGTEYVSAFVKLATKVDKWSVPGACRQTLFGILKNQVANNRIP
jgi:hypothetical protein